MIPTIINGIIQSLGEYIDGFWSYTIETAFGESPNTLLEALLSNVVALFSPLLVLALICCVIRIFTNAWEWLTND